MIEQQIIKRIRAAGLRLRFDKVVMGLVGDLKAALSNYVPEGQTIVFTLTAPIRLPGKTAAELEQLVREGLAGGELRSIIHGNEIRVRRVTGVSALMPKVAGFVHNPDSDAGLILDLAERELLAKV